MSLEDASGQTFSDSWHRVAGVNVTLRASVTAHRQIFSSQPWVILRDRFSSDWFRITPDAYDFLCRLSANKTVEHVWNESLEMDPHRALTQEEIVQLLGQMNLSNLLQYNRDNSAASLLDRFTKRRTKETEAMLMGFLSIKMPLWDPDRILERFLPLISALLTPWGLTLYLVLLVMGGKALMDESDRLFDQSAGLLAPANLSLLYIGFLVSKAWHEISHAAICKHFGGEVHTMGVMFLIFAPMPYVDVTAAWGFRNHTQRILVGAAGVMAELALAAMAALIWANTAPGTLNSLVYNLIFVASISTLVFNMNPLLRFDGYHMLVDLIGVPNLFQRSREQLKYLSERFILGLRSAQPAARTVIEAWLLPIYGAISMVYWLLLMSVIVFFIAEQYLDLGVALAILLIFFSFILPMGKFLKYLFTSPNLGGQRTQAVVISLVAVLSLLIGLGYIPIPDRIRVMGVVQAQQFQQLYSETDGFLHELLVRPGAWVEVNQPLVQLIHPELDFEIRAAQRQRDGLLAQEIRALSESVADVSAIVRQRQAVDETLTELLRRQGALLVRAPLAGIWIASHMEGIRGQWIGRGNELGTIINDTGWRFVAVLPQVASHIFQDHIVRSEVRLVGEEGRNLMAGETTVMPFEQGLLPSPALGMSGGGLIAVDPADPLGLTATEPFFRIESPLPVTVSGPYLAHGRVGTLRLTLGDRPLLAQWNRKIRQFLQRRFRF